LGQFLGGGGEVKLTAQATGQRISKLKGVKVNNFFGLGSGIFVSDDSGILVDFEV